MSAIDVELRLTTQYPIDYWVVREGPYQLIDHSK